MQQYINLFNKIKLLDEIATQIGYYGVQCGKEKLIDYIDMNCGGIPDGDFSQVVDPAAPEQFLSMYINVAEMRFAFAVTELLKMNSAFMNALEEFCTRTGRDMQLPVVAGIDAAFETMNSFVLDGMPGAETKKIVQKDDGVIVWEVVLDTHKAAWSKAGGDLKIYYRLVACFVSGLLESSGVKMCVLDDGRFSLERF